MTAYKIILHNLRDYKKILSITFFQFKLKKLTVISTFCSYYVRNLLFLDYFLRMYRMIQVSEIRRVGIKLSNFLHARIGDRPKLRLLFLESSVPSRYLYQNYQIFQFSDENIIDKLIIDRWKSLMSGNQNWVKRTTTFD